MDMDTITMPRAEARYGYTVEFTESGDATWVYASFSRHEAEQ